MTKPVNRPERVAPADFDEAVKAGIERAEQAKELSKDDLGNAAGGIVPVTPGRISVDPF